MPDLLHTLQGNDLGFYRMVANLWGIELNAPDAYTALPALVKAINNRLLVKEVVEALPTEARSALQALLENEGRLSWSLFCRRYGEVRSMGAARRDRERPDLKPASPSEILWYRALIGKAFLSPSTTSTVPKEPVVSPEQQEAQEFAYIPDDLLEYIIPLNKEVLTTLGRPASPLESANPLPATDHILDHACTLLAALRMEMDTSSLDTSGWDIPLICLRQLLRSAHLLDAHDMPKPEVVRAFLEAERSEALAQLARSWLDSTTFNELRLLPGLVFEGDWVNNPLQARQAVMEMLSHLPQDTWWSLSAFLIAVHDKHPDFQRPAGDYDSWFIRRENSDVYLRGFTAWDDVDGALVRFLITGPLHWLGILDLATPASAGNEAQNTGKSVTASSQPSAFRPSKWSADLWHGKAPAFKTVETAALRLTMDGTLHIPFLFPRAVRYQIARFCSWEGIKGDEYRYRLTPESLAHSRQNGLRTGQLVSLLRHHAVDPVPPSLLRALEHWDASGVQARLESTLLLRVNSVQILNELRRTRAARFLGEVLNPTTVIIQPGGEEAVRSALAEIGYLGEIINKR